MFEEKYKSAMDGLTPSEKAVKETLDILNAEQTRPRVNKLRITRIIAACLACLVLICGTVFSTLYISDYLKNPVHTSGSTDNINEHAGFQSAGSLSDVIDLIKETMRYPLCTSSDVTDGLDDGVVNWEYENYIPDPEGFAPGTDDSDHSDTNNQVSEVQEADLIKTNGRYIFAIHNTNNDIRSMNVFAVNGTFLKLVDSFSVQNPKEMLLIDNTLVIISNRELESRDDNLFFPNGKTVCEYYSISYDGCLDLYKTHTQDGEYVSSRVVNGEVIVVTNHTVRFSADSGELTGGDYESSLPRCDNKRVSYSKIFFDKSQYKTSCFTVITKASTDKSSKLSSLSVNFNVSTLYASKSNLYLVKNASATSKIICVSLANENFAITASCEVEGGVLNQFCLDEKDGILRVATHSQGFAVSHAQNILLCEGTKVNCLQPQADGTMKLLGESEILGEHEDVKSVRYEGDLAYVVTFERTDPLYVVDLSDPSNPKTLSKLEITGYSTYLQPFGENRLLGFGYEANEHTGGTEGLKMTMFDISDLDNVRDVSSYVIEFKNHSIASSEATYEHKAIFTDVARGLIAVPISVHTQEAGNRRNESNTYVQFIKFNGESLNEYVKVELGDTASGVRCIRIGEYCYVISDTTLVCVPLISGSEPVYYSYSDLVLNYK